MSSIRHLLDRASITQVWFGLGGGKLRHERGQAFWRHGDGWNIVLNESQGVWFDHAQGTGGGILNLIETVLGCDRKNAIGWLAGLYGVSLEGNAPSQEERQRWRTRRVRAEQKAYSLLQRRRDLISHLRDTRNHLWDRESLVAKWAREHLNEPAKNSDSRWDYVWAHALDDQHGDELDQELARIEELSPAELEAELNSKEGVER